MQTLAWILINTCSTKILKEVIAYHIMVQFLQFSRDFDETFQLLFPWPEDDHILSRSCSVDFYQSNGPLTIFQ